MKPAIRPSLRPIQYGWWVAIAGCVTMTITSTPTFQGSSVIFAAIEDDFGWSRAVISTAASLGALTMLIMGPVQGWLADRYGPGRMMLAGLMIGAVGLAILSRISNPPAYFAAWTLLSLGGGIGGFIPAMTAVNAWLPHRRATGMAIVMVGTSIGALLVPLLAWGVTEYGWRTTVLFATFVFALAAPPLAWIIGKRPDLSLVPNTADPTPTRSQPDSSPSFTPVQALRTSAFWAIAISHAFANLAVAAISAHIVLHLRDTGLSLATAATIVPVFGGVAFAAQIGGGLLGDRIDKRVGSAAAIMIQAGAMAVLAFVNSYPIALLFALLYGVGFGVRTPMMHALRGEYFGPRFFATILGLEAVPMSIGMMISPVVVGWAFDVQGSYTVAFIGLAAASVVAAVLMLFAKPPVLPGSSTSG